MKCSLGYAVFACLVVAALGSDSWSENSVQSEDMVKRSLGDLCRCCTIRREPWCCSACIFQMRSPTPFYTGKRSIPPEFKGGALDYPGVQKRPRYRSRSQCGCCFTRRLRWCCDTCRRYSWYRGKRSTSIEDVPAHDPADLYLDYGTDDAQKLSPLSPIMESYERDPVERGNEQSVLSLLDVPAFPLENTRKDCLCCFLYDAVSCCDRCKNAV